MNHTSSSVEHAAIRTLILAYTALLALALPTPASSGHQAPSLRFGDPPSATDEAPFFPASTYDTTLPSPDLVLGRSIGSRAAHHHEVERALTALASASPRARLDIIGRTHEGRALMRYVVTSAANMEQLDSILEDHRLLFDPRELDAAGAEEILARTRAVAWMAYSIHGDEMSGTDAALALAWHLTAGTSADVERLLDRLVIAIDPCMNPDGRERILGMLEQSSGYEPNPEPFGLHRGRWPWGRGNHFLFDMNRDWLPGTQPETRARWKAVLEFAPQLFVDAHEMSGLDTYLFSPPREPINRQIAPGTVNWWQRFADDQASAFDRHGWSYYTREWFESWYPGYSDAWGSLNGAVGILYEQASYRGQPLRRLSGEIETYRSAVNRQLVSSVANLDTLASNAKPLLEEYAAQRRSNVAPDTEGNDRMVCIAPDGHFARRAFLLRALLGQGIEVTRAKSAFTASNGFSHLRETRDAVEFPAGTLVVRARQPQGPLVRTAFDFDPRFSKEELEDERRELETKQQTKIYDVTAWALPQALGIEAWWVDATAVESEEVATPEPLVAGIAPPARGDLPVYGWIVDGRSDRSVAFAAAALASGLAVNVGDREFTAAGVSFTRGSVLLRAHENGFDAPELVAAAARKAGVLARAVNSGRSPDEGPDLGGGHFALLVRPRVGVLTNAPVATDEYGHVWHALDVDLGMPSTPLDTALLELADLRSYDVIVVPGGAAKVLRERAETLRAWVDAGGTLIAFGSSAAATCDPELNLSAVRLRQDALDQLERHAFAVRRERAARSIELDPDVVFDDPAPAARDESARSGDSEGEDEPAVDPTVDPDRDRADEYARMFSPEGAYLRGELDANAWLTYGCDAELPVHVSGSNAFLASHPIGVPVRLAAAERVRIAGLLWPEARERLADSAWATVERSGKGQIVLFAANPLLRGWHLGTQRLFANAVVYGPGLGADPVRGR